MAKATTGRTPATAKEGAPARAKGVARPADGAAVAKAPRKAKAAALPAQSIDTATARALASRAFTLKWARIVSAIW